MQQQGPLAHGRSRGPLKFKGPLLDPKAKPKPGSLLPPLHSPIPQTGVGSQALEKCQTSSPPPTCSQLSESPHQRAALSPPGGSSALGLWAPEPQVRALHCALHKPCGLGKSCTSLCLGFAAYKLWVVTVASKGGLRNYKEEYLATPGGSVS